MKKTCNVWLEIDIYMKYIAHIFIYLKKMNKMQISGKFYKRVFILNTMLIPNTIWLK